MDTKGQKSNKTCNFISPLGYGEAKHSPLEFVELIIFYMVQRDFKTATFKKDGNHSPENSMIRLFIINLFFQFF